MSLTRAYEDGELVAENFPVEEVSDHLEHPRRVVFADLTGQDLASITQTLAQELDLHDLAVEDALGRPQRAKLDRYPEHLFISTYQALLAGDHLETAEVAVFVTPRAMITVRKSERFDLDAVLAVWDDQPQLARFGVTFLLHGLLDAAVESYLSVLETLDDQAEQLEDDLFGGPAREGRVRRRSLSLRKNVLRLRRIALPMREVLLSLSRMTHSSDGPRLDEAMLAYYQDVYDHVLRVTDWTDTLREVIATTLETQTSLQGNRLNVTMKKLTAWAAVIAVPTLITGFYGENVPFPGFGTTWGAVCSAALIVLVTGVVYLNFRRRKWL
jgi:magnesium transporter